MQGNAGLVGVHSACERTFGPGSRMCLAEEVFKTTGLVSGPGGIKAWVQQGDGSNGCGYWKSTYGNGTVILGDSMSLTASGCENFNPVTCCK